MFNLKAGLCVGVDLRLQLVLPLAFCVPRDSSNPVNYHMLLNKAKLLWGQSRSCHPFGGVELRAWPPWPCLFQSALQSC